MHPLIIIRGETQRALAKRQVDELPEDWTVRFAEPKRSDQANSAMWAMLEDVSRDVDWHGTKLSKEEWKHVFSASLNRAKVVPGLDGGFVVLGQSTSRMSKREFADLLALIDAFGSQRGVRWTAPTPEHPNA